MKELLTIAGMFFCFLGALTFVVGSYLALAVYIKGKKGRPLIIEFGPLNIISQKHYNQVMDDLLSLEQKVIEQEHFFKADKL